MTKEMKRPTSHISGNSIKPALSKAVEFYTDNNRQAYECIHERDEYIDYLESQLNSAKPQQALPVVPECVAEFITKVKKADNNLTFAFNSKFDECPAKYWNEAIVWRLNHPEEFALAFITGKYQAEKPQLFYLKNMLTGKYLRSYTGLSMDDTTLRYEDVENKKACGFGGGTTFTQEEIDSMQTGSYEKIEVEE